MSSASVGSTFGIMSDSGEDDNVDEFPFAVTEHYYPRLLSEREWRYVYGNGGVTCKRLKEMSSASIWSQEEDGGYLKIVIKGTEGECMLAKIAIRIVLQQLHSDSSMDYNDLETTYGMYVSTVDVPSTPGIAGAIIGRKGETLRNMEKTHNTFMFVGNSRVYIVGADEAREKAVIMMSEFIEKQKCRLAATVNEAESRKDTRRDHEPGSIVHDAPTRRDFRDHSRLRDRDHHNPRGCRHSRDFGEPSRHIPRHDNMSRYDELRPAKHEEDYSDFYEWRRQDEWKRYNEWLHSK